MAGRVRGALGLGVFGVLAAVGAGLYWQHTEKDRLIAEQKRVIAELEQKLDRAWAEELVADVRVQSVVDGKMTLTFVQYAPGTETPTFSRSMTIPGEEFYVDAMVVKFERQFVDVGDGLRGKSLLLFRRMFGDQQKPVDGVPLFEPAPNGPPIPVQLEVDPVPGDFERAIWSRFWDLANDPDKAKAEGVRVAQGEAPHVKAVEGQVYKLTLRASGGLEITPRLPAAVLEKH
jgi:hypothetical protein